MGQLADSLGGNSRWAEILHPALPRTAQRGSPGAVGGHEASALQVAVTDLCPAGPIQAVEVQVESSSLANMCRAHHAVVGRMQVHQPCGDVCTGCGDADRGICGSLPWGQLEVTTLPGRAEATWRRRALGPGPRSRC